MAWWDLFPKEGEPKSGSGSVAQDISQQEFENRQKRRGFEIRPRVVISNSPPLPESHLGSVLPEVGPLLDANVPPPDPTIPPVGAKPFWDEAARREWEENQKERSRSRGND